MRIDIYLDKYLSKYLQLVRNSNFDSRMDFYLSTSNGNRVLGHPRPGIAIPRFTRVEMESPPLE